MSLDKISVEELSSEKNAVEVPDEAPLCFATKTHVCR
jgi:hypothetical protein